MVIAPANTGRDSKSNTAVIRTAHPNNGIRSIDIPKIRKFLRVLIKFTAPRIDDTPAKWREKIAKSTEDPEWAKFLLKGG